jgi:hypothetical protein
MAGKRFVTEYKDIRCFGGHEEGGWYYTVTEAIRTWKFSSAKTARRFAEKRNEEARELHRWSWEDDYHYSIENKKEVGEQDNTNEPRPHYE